MNNRANIMYFIEHLCTAAQRENHLDFVRMMQRDILRVVDAVAPSDGTGAANVKVVRRVLTGLQQKSILMPETVQEIEACLKERDTLPGGTILSPISPNAQMGPSTAIGGKDSAGAGSGQYPPHHPQRGESKTGGYASGGAAAGLGIENVGTTTAATMSTSTTRVDKHQIEQRIEEDRERHKRLRESIWTVGEDGHGEFERLWDEASEIGEDDFLAAEEDASERRIAAEAL